MVIVNLLYSNRELTAASHSPFSWTRMGHQLVWLESEVDHSGRLVRGHDESLENTKHPRKTGHHKARVCALIV